MVAATASLSLIETEAGCIDIDLQQVLEARRQADDKLKALQARSQEARKLLDRIDAAIASALGEASPANTNTEQHTDRVEPTRRVREWDGGDGEIPDEDLDED